MNTLDFGTNMPNSGNLYLRAKQKGDKLTFRIAQNPVYTGKHFTKLEDGKWDVISCPRINEGSECEFCELFFKFKAEAKKLKGVDDKKAKENEEQARNYSVAVSFYFPVLNRDTEEFGILQTTMGVRNKLNAQHEAGVKVLEKDWILLNTGSANPGERYMITPVDSADSKPLSDKEKAEFIKALAFDLGSLNEGGSTSDEIEE